MRAPSTTAPWSWGLSRRSPRALRTKCSQLDATDAYLVARSLMLADALGGLDELPPAARADVLDAAAGLLELLAELLREAGDRADGGK